VLPYLLILLAFAADRLTKWWALENLVAFHPMEINDYLTFQSTYNRGVAFGMFQGVGPIVGWFSILIVIALLVHLVRTPKHYWLLRIGLALIIGGALGNLIDRITAGEVLDFIRVSFLPGIFNVSDVMVIVGMVISLGAVFLQPEREELDEEEQTRSLDDYDLPEPEPETAVDEPLYYLGEQPLPTELLEPTEPEMELLDSEPTDKWEFGES
jgi:signal peptidase II